MKMKTKHRGIPRSREERPLTRTFNSQQLREHGSTDLGNTDSDSDDELSWEEDGDCTYTVKRKSDSMWMQRSNKLGCMLVVAVIIIAFLVAIVIYQHVTSNNEKEVCTTQPCVQASAFINSQMDRSVDPCKDFYQYSCGNWDKTVHIPDTRAKYNTFAVVADQNLQIIKDLIQSSTTLIKGKHSKSVENMKAFYSLCMNQTIVDQLDNRPLVQFIEDIGGWTISGKAWNESSWKLEKVLAKIHHYNFGPLFDIGVGVDDKNSTRYILTFSQPKLTLQAREEYNVTYSKYQQLHDAMLEFGAKIGEYLNSDYNKTKSRMDKIYTLEQKLAEIFVPKEILRNPELIYHKMKLKDLQDKIGHDWFDMRLYLKSLFDRDIPDTEDVIVYTPEYYEKLGTIVKQTDKSLLADYMVWTAVNYLEPYLPLKFSEAALILDTVETGIMNLDPLWQRCISKTDTAFGFVTGALYVQKKFSESSRRAVEDILERVRTSFLDSMPHVDWMDQTTREKAVEKLKYIKPKIGYPDWILDAVQLDKYYENVTIIKDKFFSTHLLQQSVEVNRTLNRLGTVPDRNQWDMNPYIVNAYYTPQYDSIFFPAGILQRPFYDPDFPISYSFGAVGSVIGHEMTHGFDDQGRLYDKFGNLENWWTNQSSAEFKKKSQCMIDQYSDFTFHGNHILGERTIGENMADNGGCKSAYSAFSNQKSDKQLPLPGLDNTPEQLFFIGFAQIWCSFYTEAYAKTSILTDVHSPAPIRPKGVAVNSKAFSEAFQCPKGSPMNPEHKCQVW